MQIGRHRTVIVLLAVALLAAACDSHSPSPSAAIVPVGSGAPSSASTPAVPVTGIDATPTPGAGETSSPSPGASPSDGATETPTGPAPTGTARVPVVPVAEFRSTVVSVGLDEVNAALAGAGRPFDAVELVASDAEGILMALGKPASMTESPRVVLAPSAATLMTDLAAHHSRLGLLRAAQVGPGVRALEWSGKSLFGVDRVHKLADWPLMVDLPAQAAAFDPAQTWTIVAGGDMLFDRGVYRTVKLQGKGVDYPFNGGTAKITGRYCCSSFDWPLPRTQRTGNAGAVRALTKGADLAMANLEGPAPVHATYHTQGTSFTFDQSMLAGVDRAGIDVVSLANNHIGNAGRGGIVETIAALDRLGIGHAGAGANSAAAHRAALFTVDGVRVGVLGYDAIASSFNAGPNRPGTAYLPASSIASDIRAARAAGAQVVIVYPHWGVEYHATATAQARAWGHAMIDAGADIVIGNHPHWAGAMEVYRGKPIWYALGNFVFDQTWSEPTEEGLILELTFRGTTLVQAWLHPTILLDSCQPNLLDPAGSGRVVLDQVYGASKSLPW